MDKDKDKTISIVLDFMKKDKDKDKTIIENIKAKSSVFKDYDKLIADNTQMAKEWCDTIKSILDSFVNKEIYGKPLCILNEVNEFNPAWNLNDSYSWCSLKYDMEDFDRAEMWFNLHKGKTTDIDRITLKVKDKRFSIFKDGDVIKAVATLKHNLNWTSPGIKQDQFIAILDSKIIIEIAEIMEKADLYEKTNEFLTK